MRTFFRITYWIAGILLVIPGCKSKELNPLIVINRYYDAVEKGDASQAYQYLCDRSYVIKGSDGQQMKFKARPDQASYVSLMGAAPKITIIAIEEQPQLSTPDQLLVFKITASVKEQERNVYNSRAQFYAYVGLNSEEQWSVMLPDFTERPAGFDAIPDTTLDSP